MAHRIKTLLESGKSLLENASIHLVLPEILDKIIADTGAERARIELYGEDGHAVLQRGRSKEGKDLSADEENRISRKILALVKTSRQTVVSPNAMIDPRFAGSGREQSTILHQKLLSVACAPLQVEEQVFGVLYIDNRQTPAHFNEETGRQLQELAGLLSASLKKSFDLTRHDQEERERHELHLRALREQLDRLLGHEEIIGNCPAIEEVRREIEFMKDYEFPVLILGDTGTGKELVAKALHRTSIRHNKPFVAFDCATVPENMLESELFGHERGAFTGADRAKPGIIDEAEGGTLFLDEIGNLNLEVQKKLLRFIETKTYRRLGAAQERKANVRLIFATNKDLPALVFERKFMPDLHYRLSKGRTIALPPLRERGDDVLLLAEALLRKYNRECKSNLGFSAAARARLKSHSYPGNVRELDGIVFDALWQALRAGAGIIEPWHVRGAPEAFSAAANTGPPPSNAAAHSRAAHAQDSQEEHRDRAFITGNYGHRESAGAALQIARQYELHDQLAIDVPQAVGMPFLQARDAVAGAFERCLLAALMFAAQGVQKEAIKLAQIDDKTFINKMKEHGIKKEWFVDLKPTAD